MTNRSRKSFARGIKHAEQGRFVEAIKQFELAHEQAPKDAGHLLELGKAEVQLGQLVRSGDLVREGVKNLQKLREQFEQTNKKAVYDALFIEVDALESLECLDDVKRAVKSLLDVAIEVDPLSRRAHSKHAHICELVATAKEQCTKSTQYREEGNRLLKVANGTELLDDKLDALKRASNCYVAAIEATNNKWTLPASSALRNLGVVSLELAKKYMENPNEPDIRKKPVVINFFERCLRSFQEALERGKMVQTSEWALKVVAQMDVALEMAANFAMECYPELCEDRIKFFAHMIAPGTSVGHARVRLEQHIGSTCFHLALDLSLSVKEQMSLLERAKQGLMCSCESDLEYEIHLENIITRTIATAEDHLQSVEMSLTICGAKQHILNAERALDRATLEGESLDMDLVLDALDMFLAAYRVASGGFAPDLETEAIALAGIARIHEQILKHKAKSVDYAKRSIRAALACEPREFTDCDWFKFVTAIVRDAQARVVEQEDHQRQKHLDELKDVLEVIKQKQSGDADGFVKFLYETHPVTCPQGQVIAPKAFKDSDTKMNLLNAIRHYHPDKNRKGTEMLTKVLREEICKYLNTVYARLYKSPIE